MDDFVSVKLRSEPGEPVLEFNRRLIAFWSHFLRAHPSAYESVLAEAAQHESFKEGVLREYLIGLSAIDSIERELALASIDVEQIDRDDLYSKFEATPPNWFQIPH